MIPIVFLWRVHNCFSTVDVHITKPTAEFLGSVGKLYNTAFSGVSVYFCMASYIYVSRKFRLDFFGLEIYNKNWKETEACRSRKAGTAKQGGLFICERRATS